MTLELKVTPELLEELNNYRLESPVIKSMFEQIKTKLQEEESEVCELQELIYELENCDFEDTSDKSMILDDTDTEEFK